MPIANRKAVLGYYFAVMSIVPVVGLLLGPVAVAYGIEGARRARRDPRVRGLVHAVVAILLGGAMTLLNLWAWWLEAEW